MDKIWRLLVAVFFLLAALTLIVVAYIFQHTVLAVIGIYGGLILFLLGIGKGLFAMIDHHREEKAE